MAPESASSQEWILVVLQYILMFVQTLAFKYKWINKLRQVYLGEVRTDLSTSKLCGSYEMFDRNNSIVKRISIYVLQPSNRIDIRVDACLIFKSMISHCQAHCMYI